MREKKTMFRLEICLCEARVTGYVSAQAIPDFHHGSLSSLRLERIAVPSRAFLVHPPADELVYLVVG
jgi:hypothetical protein